MFLLLLLLSLTVPVPLSFYTSFAQMLNMVCHLVPLNLFVYSPILKEDPCVPFWLIIFSVAQVPVMLLVEDRLEVFAFVGRCLIVMGFCVGGELESCV